MPEPNWTLFTSVTLLVLTVLITLARASQGAVAGESDEPLGRTETESGESPDTMDTTARDERAPGAERTPEDDPIPENERAPEDELTPGLLLVNVALTQGLFGSVLALSAVLTRIPRAALGVESATLLQLGGGIALGVALFGANELGQRTADAFEIDYEDGLRELLTPDSHRGWVVLLGVVLPVIAGFEELLFRSALVGALAVGYGLSPWLLAVLSTVAFAVGHGAQGPGGILVTGTLGGALAVAFVLSGSLLVVVVAHYLVNALEFVVHARDA